MLVKKLFSLHIPPYISCLPTPSFLHCLGLGEPLFEASSGQTPEESASQPSTVWIPLLVIEAYPPESKEVLAMKPLPGVRPGHAAAKSQIS